MPKPVRLYSIFFTPSSVNVTPVLGSVYTKLPLEMEFKAVSDKEMVSAYAVSILQQSSKPNNLLSMRMLFFRFALQRYAFVRINFVL